MKDHNLLTLCLWFPAKYIKNNVISFCFIFHITSHVEYAMQMVVSQLHGNILTFTPDDINISNWESSRTKSMSTLFVLCRKLLWLWFCSVESYSSGLFQCRHVKYILLGETVLRWPETPGKNLTKVMEEDVISADAMAAEYKCHNHWNVDTLTIKLLCCTTPYMPRWQNPWGQHGAHLGPVGPSWAPCWPYEPCYQGGFITQQRELSTSRDWISLELTDTSFRRLRAAFMKIEVQIHEINYSTDERQIHINEILVSNKK